MSAKGYTRMFCQATILDPATGRRALRADFSGDCPVAYHIGLPGLECIEIQRNPDSSGFVFLYWNEGGQLLRSRPLSQTEVAHFDRAHDHVDSYFRVLGAALGLSEHIAARVRCDAGKMADAMRRAINAHDRVRSIVPLTPRDPHIDLLRALVDRVEDLYEMAAVGGSLAARSREAIPRPQADS